MDSFFSPAKLNLLLSIHGKREDHFHELTSLIVGLDFGDQLELAISNERHDSLECSDALTPIDGTNLILKMAHQIRQHLGIEEHFDFKLKKNIPMGAGLGGASSNAVCALKAINRLLDLNIEDSLQYNLASSIGSDCSFFIHPVPSIMEGRGERVRGLDSDLSNSLSGTKLMLFKPSFSIKTPEAYGSLEPSDFESKASAFARIDAFSESLNYSELLTNSFIRGTEQKYLVIALILKVLREKRIVCNMTGSGSTCFALLTKGNESKDELIIRETVDKVFGSDAFITKASIL